MMLVIVLHNTEELSARGTLNNHIHSEIWPDTDKAERAQTQKVTAPKTAWSSKVATLAIWVLIH